MSKVDKLIDENKLHRTDGITGVKNLAIFSRLLGYKDPTYFGQFDPNGCYGDLIVFLEDNPGAVESIYDFVRENEDAYDLEEVDEEE